MSSRKLRFVATAPTGEVRGDRGEEGAGASDFDRIARFVCTRGPWSARAAALATTRSLRACAHRVPRERWASERGAHANADASFPRLPLQDPNHPASDLVTRGPKSCGWQSAR